MLKKVILNKPDKIYRSTFLWNSIGTLLMSMQSVIMLMAITRISSLTEAGIFTIAIAIANQLVCIGNYSMRTFQASDVHERNTFYDYLYARFITLAIMILCAFIYSFYMIGTQNISIFKFIVIILVCFLKAVDVLEDVYNGRYHQLGRLDVSAKVQTIRQIITIVTFVLVLKLSNNMIFALALTIIVSLLTFTILAYIAYSEFKDTNKSLNLGKVKKLLFICFPLFAGSFLVAYIGNAPKYAIDTYLTSEMQAYYGFISMPVFVINLMNGLIYNPLINNLSIKWNKKDYREFESLIKKQSFIVVVVSVICIILSLIMGLPILSLMYNTDLSMYKWEFCLLMVGGGLLAVSSFANIIITIIRFQVSTLLVYLFVSLLSYFIVPQMVIRYALKGASLVYALSMAIIVVLFYFILYAKIKRVKRMEET